MVSETSHHRVSYAQPGGDFKRIGLLKIVAESRIGGQHLDAVEAGQVDGDVIDQAARQVVGNLVSEAVKGKIPTTGT